jgi:hypothetical protein
MNRKYIVIFLCAVCVLSGPEARAKPGVLMKNFDREFSRLNQNAPSNLPQEEPRQACRLDDYGLSYMCNPAWVVEKQDDVTLIVVSTDPLTMITIRFPEPKIKFPVQLSKIYFEDKKWYQPGFQKESCTFAGREAIRIKAFPSDNPEVRVTDYYFMNQGKLVGVFFSVFPKDRFEEAQFQIKEIADSFMTH